MPRPDPPSVTLDLDYAPPFDWDSIVEFLPASMAMPAMAMASAGRAYDLAEGKRLFSQWNCSGCHANGGGGMGPPLMDRTWIYGSSPESVYSSIVRGRPNGMPSFSGRIPQHQLADADLRSPAQLFARL